jgi:hypothetical protein
MSARVTTRPVGYRRLSNLAFTRRPAAVRVWPIRSTTVSKVRSGRPRQFSVMWQKRRCSILFHLLVPGGKCETWMTRRRSETSRFPFPGAPRRVQDGPQFRAAVLGHTAPLCRTSFVPCSRFVHHAELVEEMCVEGPQKGVGSTSDILGMPFVACLMRTGA